VGKYFGVYMHVRMPESTFKFRDKFRVPTNRLREYDYSSEGAYFITICTKNRENYFGKIMDEVMVVNEMGKVSEEYWYGMVDSFENLILDEFVIMPNHVHLIIMIQNSDSDVETRRGVSLQ